MLSGCESPPPLEVDVQRGVPASQLAIRITESSPAIGDHPIEMISLNSSAGARNPGGAGTVVWVAAHIKGEPYLRPPVSLPLGGNVPGYTSSAVPPLVLGRYDVRVNARGVSALTRFSVTVHDSIE